MVPSTQACGQSRLPHKDGDVVSPSGSPEQPTLPLVGKGGENTIAKMITRILCVGLCSFSQKREALLLGCLCFAGELTSDRHENLSKAVAAWNQAGIFPAVFARSGITDATAPELFVPVVLRNDLLVARSQEQRAKIRGAGEFVESDLPHQF